MVLLSEPNTEYNPREEVIDFIREGDRRGKFSVLNRNEEGEESPMTIEEVISEIREGTPRGRRSYKMAEVLYDYEFAKRVYELINTIPYHLKIS